jgi:signal peptidase I
MASVVPRKILPFAVYHFFADYRLRLSWPWLFQQFCGLLLIVGLGAFSYLLISHFIFQSVKISGTSMRPTLYDRGSYWLNRYVYLEREPQRTDIVAVKDPQDGILIVKRVIAMPGESVYLNNGRVYVNGRRLDEFYLPPHTPTYAYEKSENEFFCCGKDQYFLMGDNRGNSMDSRTFGPVPRHYILGKVIE